MEKGRIGFVEIQSNKGGPCRVQNPWPGSEITLYRNGKPTETLSGELLSFSTVSGEMLVITPIGKPLRKQQVY
jgi:hypothetical protein